MLSLEIKGTRRASLFLFAGIRSGIRSAVLDLQITPAGSWETKTKNRNCNYEVWKMAEEWREGFPARNGWYYCQLDGGEMSLYCKKCEISGKSHWYDSTGEIITERVRWSAGSSAPR